MRLRHWRAAQRTHPSTAGPPGARRSRTGRRTARTTSLRQNRPVIWCGKDRAFITRDSSGPLVCGGAASSRRRFLVCAAVKPCVRRDEEPSPVWVKCLVASDGLLEDRPGGKPSRYLRPAARRTAMVTDQVLAARYRSCSVRPPACQVSQRPAESPQSNDACSSGPPRCSHVSNGTEHAMRIRSSRQRGPCTVQH